MLKFSFIKTELNTWQDFYLSLVWILVWRKKKKKKKRNKVIKLLVLLPGEKSADDKLMLLSFSENMVWYFMQTVS